jgi:hypothetical protein
LKRKRIKAAKWGIPKKYIEKDTYSVKEFNVELVSFFQILIWRAAEFQLTNHELGQLIPRQSELSNLELKSEHPVITLTNTN